MLVGFVNHWATTGTPSMPFSMGNATAWSLQIGFYFIYLFIFGYTRGMWKFLGQGWNLCHSSNSSCHSDKARALIPRTPKIGLKTNSNNKKLFHFVLCYMSIPPKFPNWRAFFLFVCLFLSLSTILCESQSALLPVIWTDWKVLWLAFLWPICVSRSSVTRSWGLISAHHL